MFLIRFVLLIVFWGVSLFWACFFGAYPIPYDLPFSLVGFSQTVDPVVSKIFFELRVPRVLLAALCGGCLAVAGVCLQGVLQNSLADPFTLGLSQGAACGASIILVVEADFFVGGIGTYLHVSEIVAFAAFLGATFATFGTLWLGANRGRFDVAHILLAGLDNCFKNLGLMY